MNCWCGNSGLCTGCVTVEEAAGPDERPPAGSPVRLSPPERSTEDIAADLELMADAMATPSIHGPTTVGQRDDDADAPLEGVPARSPSADLPAREFLDCPYCRGEGEIAYNPSRRNDPQCETSAPCPTCRGAGAVPARTWDITVCVLCLEHVNDCQCDLDGWRGDEPPTMQLTVELDEAA